MSRWLSEEVRSCVIRSGTDGSMRKVGAHAKRSSTIVYKNRIIFCVFALTLFLHQVSGKRNHIISTTDFIILDADQAQTYPFFGFSSCWQSFPGQLFVIVATTSAICFAWLIFRRQGERATLFEESLSSVSDFCARIVFYFQQEISAYLSAFIDTMVTLVNAPLGVGLHIASRIGDRSFLESNQGHMSRKRCNGSSNPSYRPSRSASRVNTGIDRQELSPANHFSGLYNTGNSCFLNSTLQSLAAVDEVQTFLEHIVLQAEAWDVPTPVTDALYDLVLQLNSPSTRRSALAPRQLTQALSNLPQNNVGSFFYAHQQQDAHELLVLITGALDDEIKAITNEEKMVMHSRSVGLQAEAGPFVSNYPKNIALALRNPFRALIAQRTACLDCGYVEAVRHFPTDELSLTVPSRPGSAVTIEACLANWSKIEIIDWVCFRCSVVRTMQSLQEDCKALSKEVANDLTDGRIERQSASAKKKSGAKRRKLRLMKEKEDTLAAILDGQYSEDEVEASRLLETHGILLDRTFSRTATKQVMLARPPKVLVLHLNRSSYSASNFGASKNNAVVLFDEELDLSPIVTGGDLCTSGDVPISRGATPATDEKETSHHSVQPRSNGISLKSTSPTRYRICAIVVHYGGHSSGHYVAFRRRTFVEKQGLDVDEVSHDNKLRGYDQWYRISDESVTRCSLRDVLVQNPFLLFYERCDGSVGGEIHEKGSLASISHSTSHSNFSSSSVPSGFEHLNRSHIDRLRAQHQPRVIQRWESNPTADVSV